MSFSEALDELSNYYVIGTAGFYSQMIPNPWQDAHDELESKMIQFSKSENYFSNISKASEAFLARVKKLIDAFKLMQSPIETEIKPSDAFVIADPDKIRRLTLLSIDSCLECSKMDSVRFVLVPGGISGLYCVECLPNV